MKHGICSLSIVPLRAEPADASEMVSQLLFGELYTVLESRKKWLRIKMQFDEYEGWIDRKQHFSIAQDEYNNLCESDPTYLIDTAQMVDLGGGDKHQVLVQGSTFYNLQNNSFHWLGENVAFNGQTINGKQPKSSFVDIAFGYLNAPYLWGGRSPFGIDCSGFSQLVYKLGGYNIPRDAKDQALLGEPLSFIEEAEPGDLAFFDNKEGLITHVGILLADNFIIHASGKVRLDRLDQHGIYNPESREHTHRLRVIKKIF